MTGTSVRDGYDAIARPYAEHFRDELAARPYDRATLSVFAELTAGRQVAEVGCGSGETTEYLHSLGVDVFGVDLSPEMVGLARQRRPDLDFRIGSMTALDIADGALGGLVAWYSIIHLPREELARAFTEFHRVLDDDGMLLLAFQVGTEPWDAVEPFGTEVTLRFHRFLPEQVTALLHECGFTVRARLYREAEPEERTPQAHLLARRTSAAG